MQEQLTLEQLRDIYDECGGDPVKVSARLGISATELAERASLAPASNPRRREPPADLGQPYFRQHIVSVRHVDRPEWPKEDLSKIEDARAKYEAGTHTICQNRDRNFFVLYCVPLRQRVGARKFFRTFD